MFPLVPTNIKPGWQHHALLLVAEVVMLCHQAKELLPEVTRSQPTLIPPYILEPILANSAPEILRRNMCHGAWR